MKKKLQAAVRGLLTTYALTTTFHAPFSLSQFETKLDYIIASVYELLGEYQFEFVLIWMLTAVFYYQAESKVDLKNRSSKMFAGFFTLCLLFGRSYHELASWDYCLGSPVNFLKFCLAFLGYGYLFYVIIALAYKFFKNSCFVSKESHFFSKNAFLKAFLVLSVVYGAVVLISYPGTLCWDTVGQIEQVIMDSGYSAHHPLAHTLLVGGMVQLGYLLFGVYEPGLFAYMIVQVVMLAATLASTIAVLAKRKVQLKWLTGLLLLYCITPVYTNIVSIAIKDVPYCAFVIGYGVCFALLMETPEYIKNKKFVICFILMQLGTILFRNNGLPLVLLSGLAALVYLFGKYVWKERLQYCLAAFVISIAAAKLITLLLVQATGAVEGSSAEMLSIPFQQTARYLQLYKEEISMEEKIAIEEVLGSVDDVAAMYDPAISDPVKALFDKTSTPNEMLAYLAAWGNGLIKHPLVYIEAFLAHVYGWFTPGVSNAIRYEIEYDVISQQGLFPNAQKILLFIYRFADRISILSILQNVGAFVWGLFFLAYYQYKEKIFSLLYAGLPLWISLLVCMASPCFIYHPRYALPIIFLLPYLYVMTMSGRNLRPVKETI